MTERALQQAHSFARQGRFREAEGLYREILQVLPNNFEAIHNLGWVGLRVGDYAAAIRLFRQALQIQPNSITAYNSLGAAFQAINRHEDAIETYRRALEIEPNFADAHHNLGSALKNLGRIEESRQAFERAVALAPRRPQFLRSLVDTRRVMPDDPYLPAMERLSEQLGNMPSEARIALHFALAKAYDDLGQHDRSFHHQLEGNALKRRQIVYDEGNTLGMFARTRAIFDKQLMHMMRNVGDPSPLPVFIVGMPRSGTSLAEQILASHPKVFGAGELGDFELAAAALRPRNSRETSFPELIPHISADQFRSLGERYYHQLAARAPTAARVTDKMMINFRFIGLINLALPNARIIHIRRDPVDTCLSCFSILLRGEPYTFDLAELGRYYRAYDRLMAHWREVLPEGAMLEVRYEELVADLEGQARRMIAHCGLGWDPACLNFHENNRPMRTASALQVRQPIYQTSVGRWRPQDELLAPLLEGFGLSIAVPGGPKSVTVKTAAQNGRFNAPLYTCAAGQLQMRC